MLVRFLSRSSMWAPRLGPGGRVLRSRGKGGGGLGLIIRPGREGRDWDWGLGEIYRVNDYTYRTLGPCDCIEGSDRQHQKEME